MKKIIALLTAGALLAIVSPMVMAADLNFNGKINSQMQYNISNPATTHVDKWNGQTNVDLGASLGDNLKAGFAINGLQRDFMGGWQNNLGFSNDPTNPAQILSGGNGITIDKAWVSSKGALWNNGPEVTTRLGSQNIQYSPYVASVTDPGISVEGTSGAVTMGAFNAWNTANPGYGVHASIKPSQGNELNGTYVKVNNETSYAVDGQVKPSEALTVSGVYANQSSVIKGDGKAYQIGANYQLAENLGVHAGYKNFDPNFNPTWRNTDMVPDIEGNFDPATNNVVTDNYAKKGYNMGVTAQLAGLDVTSNLDVYTQQANDPYQAADQIAGSKHQELKTTVSHDFVMGTSKLTAGVSEKYDFKSKGQEDLDGNLKYTAPNGLSVELNRDFHSHETTAAAGLSMSF